MLKPWKCNWRHKNEEKSYWVQGIGIRVNDMWFWQGFTPFLALTLQLNSVYFNLFSSLSTSMAWSSSCSLIPISLFWWSMPWLMELWGWNAELFQMSGVCVYLRINGQKGNHKLRFTGSSVLPFSTSFLGWFLRNNMEQIE